jgi:hypothetical protein
MISEKRICVRNKNITMGLVKGTPSERILYLKFVEKINILVLIELFLSKNKQLHYVPEVM